MMVCRVAARDGDLETSFALITSSRTALVPKRAMQISWKIARSLRSANLPLTRPHRVQFSALKVYNSLTSSKEPVVPELMEGSERNDKHTLTWYSCGPTVYDDAHLGHARTYVCTDIIRRILHTTFNVNTNFVMGVTDVDDKIIKRSQEVPFQQKQPNVSNGFLDLARRFENEFFDDLDSLNVLRPTTVTRVSEYIPDIIQYIETIIRNGYAYESNNGVYFSCNELGDRYGALARSKLDISVDQNVQNVGSTVNSEKKDPRDFALWKKSNVETNAGWDSPWGYGRPGWHIECSAMTHAVVGKTIDIHSGGIDLKFPHHNNEVAQCK